MLENNENLVTEVTENVEQTTEETVGTEQVAEKTFTQSELNEIVKKNKARAEAKIRKEYDRKYGNLTDVLKAGTGTNSVEEMTDTFTKFYEGKGIKIRKDTSYTEKDLEVLALADANEIINSGYDEVAEEVDRLTGIGLANMTSREKAVYKVLAEHRLNADRQKELSKIGVTDEVYNSKDFQDFAKQFNPTTPITKVWNIYNKMQPKKDIKPMGSMKNTVANEAKDFYSAEEISKLTEEDLKNPKVWEAVRRSMTS